MNDLLNLNYNITPKKLIIYIFIILMEITQTNKEKFNNLCEAVEKGDLESVKQYYDDDLPCLDYTLTLAFKFCQYEILEYLFEVKKVKCSDNFHINIEAVCRTTLPFVIYLFEKIKPTITEHSIGCGFNSASSNGNLDVVIYLHKRFPGWCTDFAMFHAAANGHFEVVKYIYEKMGYGCCWLGIDHAAMNGHFEIVKYLVEVVGAKYSHHAIEWALENGHQEIADYLSNL
jgi:hypothetical protein